MPDEKEYDNHDRTQEEFNEKYKGQIIAVTFLLITLIAFIIWGTIEYITYYNAKHSESFAAPRIFCNDLSNGASGTKCYNAETKEGDRVAWRDLPDGTFQCQDITINKNIVNENYDFSNYNR